MTSHAWDGASHRLDNYELSALARGRLTATIASKLAAAESSKHRLLVEAVRRRVADIGPSSDRDILEAAVRVLTEVEAHSPAVVASFLMLPQIGSWAVGCLRRMANAWGGEATEGQAPLGADLGYLAAVAAAAALRSEHRADLLVPLRAGTLLLPGIGMASIGPGDSWEAARMRTAGNVATAVTRNRTITLLVGGDQNVPPAAWHPVPQLHAEAGGITLAVALDALDPFLSSLGQAAATPSAKRLAMWQQRLSEAWQILVQYDRETAKAFAITVSTLVPLADSSISDARSATSGWTFGAIGLSFPETPATLAEIFIHEFHHIILGAVEDLEPLVNTESLEPSGYAPWRDDPRPTAGLLHGCYAYLGLTAFWRRQRHLGGDADRSRSEAEFARWRLAALDTAKRVAGSANLTETGRRVVVGMSEQLARWRGDPVTADAERLASEARAEHRARWRINHMHPPDSAVTELASAWLSGAKMVEYRTDMDSVAETRTAVVAPVLGYFMEMRYRDPSRLDLLIRRGNTKDPLNTLAQRINEADIALLHGDSTTAVREYLRRLHATDDMSAWVGLATVLQHSGPSASAWVLAERPELVAAVYSRIRAIRGEPPQPIVLTEWLGRCLMPL